MTTSKETEKTASSCRLSRLRFDIAMTNMFLAIALILVGMVAVKQLILVTKTTKALSEVAQKAGVEFPTTTNNVLGVWQVVKPK